MKRLIDKIIDNLDIDFSNNNYGTSNFTGQTTNDINTCKQEVEDPNHYKETPDYSQQKHKFFRKFNNQSSMDCCAKIYPIVNEPVRKEYEKNKQKEPPVEIKETIHIQTEINDISDILKLI
jgi:hypothetical protein